MIILDRDPNVKRTASGFEAK